LKWFKHYSNASDDEFISGLEDEFGLLGYARWWKLLEVIAAQMDESDRCFAEYSWKKWGKFLKTNQNILKTFLEHCQNNSKTFLTESENILRIEVPKLLEIRDNHTKNLQAGCKRQTSKIKKKIKNKNTPPESDFIKQAFEEDWKLYKRPGAKGDKQKAKKYYIQTVGVDPEKNRPLFQEKIKQQIASVSSLKFLPHADRFFRDWQNLEFEAHAESKIPLALQYY
jgi:hypothetical protein